MPARAIRRMPGLRTPLRFIRRNAHKGLTRALSLPINLSAMTDRMNNYYCLLMPNYFIEDTVIANSEFIKSRKVACQRFPLDLVQVCAQPTGAINDAAANGFI